VGDDLFILERTGGLPHLLVSHSGLVKKSKLKHLIFNPLEIKYDIWKNSRNIFIYNATDFAIFESNTGEEITSGKLSS
jgi:hypothetical protein